MTDEILRCGTCFRPVRIVRLTSDMPEAFGHVENPRNLHHRVTRLARTAAAGHRRLSEGSASCSGMGTPADSSDRRSLRRAAPSAGVSMPVASKSPRQRRSQPDPSPAPASASGLGHKGPASA